MKTSPLLTEDLKLKMAVQENIYILLQSTTVESI